jgi:hypothetical protein
MCRRKLDRSILYLYMHIMFRHLNIYCEKLRVPIKCHFDVCESTINWGFYEKNLSLFFPFIGLCFLVKAETECNNLEVSSIDG